MDRGAERVRRGRRQAALIAAALAFVLASFPTPSPAAEVHLGRPVMGTVLQLTVVAETEPLAREAAEAALAEAVRWDDVLTTWRPEGELARLGARAGSGAVAISAELASSLGTMGRLHRETRGAFDPAVGPWVRWWSRGGEESGEPAPSAPRRFAEAIDLRPGAAALASGAAIDAGGIGKGIACDAIVELLEDRSIAAALVDFGRSSLTALGAPPEEPRGWPIAVAGLRRGESHGALFLRDESLSTSRTLAPGDEAGPIVDPRSGEIVRENRLAVVVASRAADAEAWSTALVVLGRSGIETAERAGVDVLFEDEQGLIASPGLARRLAVRSRASAGRGSSPPPPSSPDRAGSRASRGDPPRK